MWGCRGRLGIGHPQQERKGAVPYSRCYWRWWIATPVGIWKYFKLLRRGQYAWNHKRVWRIYCVPWLNEMPRGKRQIPWHEPHARESPLFMRFQFKKRTLDPRFFPRDCLVLKGKEKAA